MSLDTWVSLVAIAGFGVALVRVVRSGNHQLRDEIRRLDTKIDASIDRLDEKFSGRIEKLDEKLTGRIEKLDEKLSGRIDRLDEKLSGRIEKLDDRVYALGVGLKPLLDEARQPGPAA